nr:type II toxin-antitoxin system RelE/ParE family toxin [Leptospira alexanderi]
MKPSELHIETEEDAIQAVEFYQGCRSRPGELFFARYVRTRSLIEQFPDGGRVIHTIRIFEKYQLDFPYSIYYLNLDDKILILAVIRDSRRPRLLV